MTGKGSSRRWLVVVLVPLLLVALGGYAVADARDLVPGVLTTKPPLTPYPEIPSAPGLTTSAKVAPIAAPLGEGSMPVAGKFAEHVGPALADPALGPEVSAVFVDAETGTVLLDDRAATAREPASVTKVLTGAAALHSFGPAATLETTVVGSSGSSQITLVGSGDVLMGAGQGDPDDVQGRAGLADLAAGTAAALKKQDRQSVTLTLDDSVLGGVGWGESMGPGWSGADLTRGFVAPVTGLAVNAGRIRDEPYAPRVADPGLDAAQQFATALEAAGVAVDGPVKRQAAPQGVSVLASVHSASMAEIVGYMLDHSDNNAAESLSRLVAVKRGGQPTFIGGGQAVLDAVAELGVSTAGCVLADGSGLSDGSKLTATVLANTLTVASGDKQPELRPLLRGLPVAGLTGTLTDRFDPASGASEGVGRVRAKTGSLTGVSALAGQVTTADGRLVSFAVIADAVPATEPARAALDRISVAVGSCGCS